MLPVRCTCLKVLYWLTYQSLCETMTPDEALQTMGVHRFCCRRMYLSEPQTLDTVLSSYTCSDILSTPHVRCTIQHR